MVLYCEWSEAERQPIDEENWLQSMYDPIDDHQFIGLYGSFPSGTVLGCLLDFTQHTFAVYVNGQKVIFQKKVPFSCNAYYVFVEGDLLYCNFGQVPFKYPPPELPANCPSTELIRQTNKLALYSNVYLMPLFENQVRPYFTDEKQKKVKLTLEQLVNKGDITEEKIQMMYTQLWEEERFHHETYGLRWLQAIIEMENIADGKINDWAILVQIIVHLMYYKFSDYFRNFIVPYSKLRETEDNRSTNYRTLAILFAILLKNYTPYYNITVSIYLSLSSFLFSAFLTTTEPITAMFALIGLGTVKEKRMQGLKNKEFIEKIIQELGSTEFTEKLQEWKRIIENTRKMDHFIVQLHLVIQHFEHSFQSFSALLPATATSLSPSKCTSDAKLSSDCLSLRSDFQWQSACSYLSVDNSLSLTFPVFYFEATLLTSGPMRIGWATQRWQVETRTSKLGGNECSFAYDGSTSCIWHQDLQLRVTNVPKWKAGDVIGCLLDLTLGKEKFTFYQNGERIQTNGDIYSRVSKKIVFSLDLKIIHVYERNDSLKSIRPFISGHPYHAALSLGPYQQVTVNFGRTFFSFPPKCLDYWDFQQYSEHLKVHGSQLKSNHFNISSATNSIISIQGKTTTRDFFVNPSTVHSYPTTESTFIIKEPSTCGVCKKESHVRLRTLKNCPHFDICIDCASKNIICPKCPP